MQCGVFVGRGKELQHGPLPNSRTEARARVRVRVRAIIRVKVRVMIRVRIHPGGGDHGMLILTLAFLIGLPLVRSIKHD